MRTAHDVHDLVNLYGSDPLQLLAALDGFYECPVDPSGNRHGSLVGYAGRYDDGDVQKQFVGEVYANFAKAEEWPEVMELYADGILADRDLTGLTFCGAPMGGITLAQVLAQRAGGRYIFAEKKVTKVATPTSREESTLILGRHQVYVGEQVVICEDVLNNFSTTGSSIKLIESFDARVVAIVGLLNRSPVVGDTYHHRNHPVPVHALVRRPFLEYRQDDQLVAADVAAGNVVWKPKDEWEKLTGRKPK